MANDVAIPAASEALVDDSKLTSASWYRVFAQLVSSFNATTRQLSDAVGSGETLATTVADLGTRIDGNDTDIVALDTRVDALEAGTGVVPIVSGVLSAQATLDSPVSAAFDMYEIDLMSIAPVTDNSLLYMRMSQSGYLAGASDYAWARTDAATQTTDEADSELEICAAIGNSTNESYSGTIRVFRPGVASFEKTITWHGMGRTGSPNHFTNTGGGRLLANAGAIDGVRLLFSSGNIASGFYAVRGYKF